MLLSIIHPNFNPHGIYSTKTSKYNKCFPILFRSIIASVSSFLLSTSSLISTKTLGFIMFGFTVIVLKDKVVINLDLITGDLFFHVLLLIYGQLTVD